METETEGLELWKNDPLIYLLKERLHVSDTKITLGLTGIAAIVFFGLGWIANRSYTGTGIRFEDTQYLYFELVRVFVLIPLSIGFYVWQPGAFMNLFENLERFENTLLASSLTKVKDTDAIKEANEKLQELRTRYSIVAGSFPTWPIPARLFRNFSITATLPMVSGLVSMIIGFTRQQ
ncbi:MAG: hypothetical protein P8186_32400 [Anaerolineae bacterium]|jgi:hypothetical protein